MSQRIVRILVTMVGDETWNRLKADLVVNEVEDACAELGYDTEVVEINEALFDQYGNLVPADLVLLPDIEHLDEAEFKMVMAVDWYEVEHPKLPKSLLASAAKLEGLSESDLENVSGIALKDCLIYKIDDVLKRGNSEDGFYHA